MWRLHFPKNKGKQEQAVDPLLSTLVRRRFLAGFLSIANLQLVVMIITPESKIGTYTGEKLIISAKPE